MAERIAAAWFADRDSDRTAACQVGASADSRPTCVAIEVGFTGHGRDVTWKLVDDASGGHT